MSPANPTRSVPASSRTAPTSRCTARRRAQCSCVFLMRRDREQRLTLPACTDGIWHGRVPGLPAGQRYGFRADGDDQPERGLLFNPNNLLLDPYAQALSAAVEPHPRPLQARRRRHRHGRLGAQGADTRTGHLRLAGQRPAGNTLAGQPDLRVACPRLQPAQPGHPGRAARHLPGACPPGQCGASDGARRHRRPADALLRLYDRTPPGGTRPAQLLGLQPGGLLRARSALRRRGRGQRIQDDGADTASGRHRGDPGCGL